MTTGIMIRKNPIGIMVFLAETKFAERKAKMVALIIFAGSVIMIFLASIEVKPLLGAEMRTHQKGAALYALIPAKSRREASRKLRIALEEDKYQLVKTDLLARYDEFTWESDVDRSEYDKLAKRAALENDVVYGPFYTWRTDEE